MKFLLLFFSLSLFAEEAAKPKDKMNLKLLKTSETPSEMEGTEANLSPEALEEMKKGIDAEMNKLCVYVKKNPSQYDPDTKKECAKRDKGKKN